MSVDIAGNPWKFAQDGSGTNPVGFSYFNPICPTDVIITKCVTPGSIVHFTDFSGRDVINFESQPGDTSFRFGKIGVIYGLKCVQFDEGEMIVVV